MKLSNFYESVVKYGIQADPRGRNVINKQIKELKKSYQKLRTSEKKVFDKESFSNPYADTRVLCGDKDTQVKRILIGIDIDASELLLTDWLKQQGKDIDLVISHHPQGIALSGLSDVMHLQIDLLEDIGISRDIAEEFSKKRIEEVERRVLPANHNRAVDIARILGIPFMSIHTAADNFVCSFVQGLMDRKKPKTLNDVLNILNQIPEYKDAITYKAGPKIIIGDPKKKSGKIIVEMTGGTEGTGELFGRLSQAGVGTIIGMHLSEEHFKKIKPEHINVIIAGHISSDTLGLNLLLDKIEKQERLEFVCCSGFRRIRR